MDGQKIATLQIFLDISIPKDPMIKYRLLIPEMGKTTSFL
jgi:hypothetical protein